MVISRPRDSTICLIGQFWAEWMNTIKRTAKLLQSTLYQREFLGNVGSEEAIFTSTTFIPMLSCNWQSSSHFPYVPITLGSLLYSSCATRLCKMSRSRPSKSIWQKRGRNIYGLRRGQRSWETILTQWRISFARVLPMKGRLLTSSPWSSSQIMQSRSPRANLISCIVWKP